MKPNDQINNYTLLCECGKGSFGKVFLAQRDDGKYVAFKVVSLLGDAGERELQAIESYRKCPLCESLLEIFDFVIQEDEDRFYYTMELADNILGANSKDYVPCTLEAILKEQKKLNVAQTRELVYHLLEGLSILHKNKLVHRDIKPANIVWINGRPKLGDIGLLANDQSMTFRAGSDGYMPSADSPISRNSTAVDLFAMTRLIFCCLSGKTAQNYMDFEEWSDDLKNNGKDLMKIMMKSDEELASMDIDGFKALIKPKAAPYMSAKDCSRCFTCSVIASKIPSAVESETIEDNAILTQYGLSELSCLSKLSSADSWLSKQKLTKKDFLKIAAAMATGATIAPAATATVGTIAGTVAILGAPLALLAGGGILISKYLKK